MPTPSTRPWISHRSALIGAALAGTLAATYPLLIGRSLVTPANGPTALLYDQPPFVYGYGGGAIEDTRGTDVGAMMWGVLPYTVIQREALRQGEWPLWNRYNGNGQPLWGQGQTFFLDPVHLLSLLIPDPAWAMDLRFIAGRATFALGAGAAVWMATGNVTASALVAFAAPFVGHFSIRFNHPAYFSIVYAPWVLAALAAALRADGRRSKARAAALLAGATYLQVVGTTPKEGIVALAAVYVVGLAALVVTPGRWSNALGRLDTVMTGAAVGLLLSAPHWLVFLDTLSRASTDYDQPQVQLAGWYHLIGYTLGGALPGHPLTGGHPLLVMAALGTLARPRPVFASPLGFGAVVAMLVMSALAFGVVPPATLLAIPLVRNIHHVFDAFLSATIPVLLVLAGYGVKAALEPASRGQRLRLGVALVLAAAAIGWGVPVDQSTAVISIAYASIAGALLVMVGLAIRGAMVRGTLITAGLAAALVPGGLHLESGVAAVDKLLLQPRLRARLTAPSPAIETVRDHGSGEPFRIAPIEDVLFQGAQAYWGLESTGTADAVRLRAIEDLSDLSGVERTSWIWRTALHAGDGATVGRFLDLLNVRYLVTRVDRVPAGAHVLEQRGADQLCIVERPTAWPRAFFAAGVGRHRGVHEFARLLALADGPFVSVEEREDAAVAAVYGLPERGPIVPASKYILTPNTSAFRVHAPGAGVAVLSESFVDRDFRATLNDQPVPYIRVNHAFKGVAIPGSGEWDVRFEYRPDLWGPAWAAAGLGLAWVAALLVFSRLRPDAVQGDDHRR